jgi:hypothetical protein
MERALEGGNEDIVMKCDEATMLKDFHTTQGKGKVRYGIKDAKQFFEHLFPQHQLKQEDPILKTVIFSTFLHSHLQSPYSKTEVSLLQTKYSTQNLIIPLLLYDSSLPETQYWSSPPCTFLLFFP